MMQPMYQPGAPLRLTHAWSTTAARAIKSTDQEFTAVCSFQRQGSLQIQLVLQDPAGEEEHDDGGDEKQENAQPIARVIAQIHPVEPIHHIHVVQSAGDDAVQDIEAENATTLIRIRRLENRWPMDIAR